MNRQLSYRLKCLVPISFVIMFTIMVLLTPFVMFPNAIPKSYAHAFTLKSDPSPSQSLPTPPSKVDVYFSEPVDLRYSTIKVVDAAGIQVDNRDDHNIGGDPASLSVTLPSSRLKDGIYTVSTKVLSATDGHVVDNAFVFGIGQAAVPSSAQSGFLSQGQLLYIPNAIARFPAYVGQVLVVGSAFATLWLWRPISKISWLEDLIAPVRSRIDRSLIILMIIGSAVLLVSDLGIIYVQAKDIGTGIGETIGTKFGNVWVIRTIESFILLAVSLWIYLRKIWKKKPVFVITPTKVEVTSLLVIGLTILTTTTLIGHGATSGQLLPIASDFIHNLAASIWIGGVIYLAFIVAPKLRQATRLEENVKASVLSILIPRFSTIPVTILGVIVVTGPLLLYFIESNLDFTLASLYGKWLIIKLLLAATMIAIGGYNQRILQSNAVRLATVTTTHIAAATVESTRRGRGDGGEQIEVDRGKNDNNKNSSSLKDSKKRSIVYKFNRSTKAEALVGIALLAAVALLVNTGTPASQFQSLRQQQSASNTGSAITAATIAQQQQQHFTSTRFVEDGNRVILSISPFGPGNNNFKISFLDSKGIPVDIKSAQIRYTQTEKGIGPINVDTMKVSKGVFSANAAFGLPGQWNLEVEGVQSKTNQLNIVTSYDLFVKPKLDQLNLNIQEHKISHNSNSQPLYPVYDKSRNAIWVGDTAIDSGRIFEYNLNSGKSVEHKVTGVSIITVMALDSHNQLWFIDPLSKNLGQYNTATGSSRLYKIPGQGIISGIAVDLNDNVWLTSPTSNAIFRFNTQSKNFTVFTLPTSNAQPLGIMVDQTSGQIWITEGIGKLANIDPANKYKISEYAPPGPTTRTGQTNNNNNNRLKSPTALLSDPITGDIYISQHDGHTVTVFNPLLKTFKNFPSLDPNGLPFGMAIDNNHNLWVAEHTVNKIAAIDPLTGANKEVTIPNKSPFVQWITADSKGNIWLAEQRGNSLAVVTSTPKLGQASNSGSQVAATSQASNSNSNNNNNNNLLGFPRLGLSYADVVGPSMLGGIIVCSLFYAKSVIDLKQSIKQVTKAHKDK